MTGTDEHGMKVAEAASKQGDEVKHYCDKISQTVFYILSYVLLLQERNGRGRGSSGRKYSMEWMERSKALLRHSFVILFISFLVKWMDEQS